MTIEELEKIINTIDEKEKNRFLAKILNKNETILNKFRSSFIDYFPKVTKKEYENMVASAIEKAEGRDGYIDYNEARKYTTFMYGFIRESKKLIELKNYESAFDIVEVILDSIPDTNIDDSNGSTGGVAYDCIENIENILGYVLISDDKLSNRILKYILDEIKDEKLYNYGIELYPLLNYFIDENRNIAEIKETLKTYLDNNKKDRWVKNEYVKILENLKNR